MRRKPPRPLPDSLNKSESHTTIRRRPAARYARKHLASETEAEWPILYEKLGFTIDRIAAEYGVAYGRVRTSLLDQDVKLRPKGRAGLRLSPLVRIAKLEERVDALVAQIADMDKALDFLVSAL